MKGFGDRSGVTTPRNRWFSDAIVICADLQSGARSRKCSNYSFLGKALI